MCMASASYISMWSTWVKKKPLMREVKGGTLPHPMLHTSPFELMTCDIPIGLLMQGSDTMVGYAMAVLSREISDSENNEENNE